jgi:hypothetical protein
VVASLLLFLFRFSGAVKKRQKQKNFFMEEDSMAARLALGNVVATPGALEALQEAGQGALEFIRRHVTGDWGDLSAEDKAENELSVREGFRILSAYTLKSGVKIWLISEADRSATTILLPEDY